MARRITMDLLVRVLGQKEVTSLHETLMGLNKKMSANNILVQHGRTLNTQQTNALVKQNVALQARLKSGDKSIQQLAQEQVLNEALNQQWQHRLDIERRAIVIKEQMSGVSRNYARYLADEQIIVEKNSQAQFENMRMMQFRRREILASTMAIFGMTMSIWQVTNALSALSGENEELKKLENELKRLAEEMKQSEQAVRKKIKEELFPQLKKEMEKLRKRLQEFGRENEMKPLEIEMEKIQKI